MTTSLIRQSDRGFGLTFAAVFAVLFLLGWLLFDTHAIWAAILSLAFFSLAIAVPSVLLPLNRLWHLVAGKLGLLNTRLLMGLFFFAIIWPSAALMRRIGRDPMNRKIDTNGGSYWAPVTRHQTAETLGDMF